MNRKKKRQNRLIIFILSLCLCSIGCSIDINQSLYKLKREKSVSRTVYSWNREIFEEDPNVLSNELLSNRIDTIYQGLYPSDFSKPELADLVGQYRDKNIETAYLVGDPTWKDSETVIYWALQPLVEYNRAVAAESRINEVCFDIEFFNSDETSIEDYTVMMKGIYEFCHVNSIKVIVCLPYWISTVYGQSAFDELLDYMDVLSCSVFLVGQEEKLMQTVNQLCKEKDKPFEAILDLQPENETYRVREVNTYFHKGLTKVLTAAEQLEQGFGCNVSIHNLSEYRKMLRR